MGLGVERYPGLSQKPRLTTYWSRHPLIWRPTTWAQLFKRGCLQAFYLIIFKVSYTCRGGKAICSCAAGGGKLPIGASGKGTDTLIRLRASSASQRTCVGQGLPLSLIVLLFQSVHPHTLFLKMASLPETILLPYATNWQLTFAHEQPAGQDRSWVTEEEDRDVLGSWAVTLYKQISLIEKSLLYLAPHL